MTKETVVKTIKNLIDKIDARISREVRENSIPEARLLKAIFGEKDDYKTYREIARLKYDRLFLQEFYSTVLEEPKMDEEISKIPEDSVKDLYKLIFKDVFSPRVLYEEFKNAKYEASQLSGTLECLERRINFRIERIEREKKRQAPKIIINNEYRLLKETIQQFEIIKDLNDKFYIYYEEEMIDSFK